jgi:putative MATE family efflux protein
LLFIKNFSIFSVMWKDRDRIVNQPILQSLISLAMPAVGSTLFFVIYEIIDMFWIGKLGARPVAALSAASFFVWMLRGLALTVATGAIAMVSRRAGEKNRQRLEETVIHALVSTGLFSIFIIALFIPIVLPLFRWIGLESGVAALSREYALIFLSGLLFVYLMLTAEHIIRGVGNTKIPMIIMGFSLMLNAALDPVFIFVLDMGLKGAAVATVLAQVVGCILMVGAIWHFLPHCSLRCLSLRTIFFKDYFIPIVRIGAPISLSTAAFSMIYLVLSGIISMFGNAPLAAVGIGHRIEAFPYFVALGFSMATATMVGQNLGAGQPVKARASAILSLKIASGILLMTSLIFLIFPEALYRFFIADSAVIRHGTAYLRIVAFFEVFMAFEVVLEGAFTGAGDTRPPFIIIFTITFMRIPLSYIFGISLGFGVLAIWVVISVTTFLKGILMFLWFQKGHWMRKKV